MNQFKKTTFQSLENILHEVGMNDINVKRVLERKPGRKEGSTRILTIIFDDEFEA
jgi:hypothetical protein